ncbi:unnamed protein product [Pleuronectes platessa]|uniref:Uncharacterized protein n=1 Tax=Pleuronectes platessa TaxID=8262 RepID=A0A9N7Z063_PLEPL|nr:unnamed protein product [Pleuronectes platessa]
MDADRWSDVQRKLADWMWHTSLTPASTIQLGRGLQCLLERACQCLLWLGAMADHHHSSEVRNGMPTGTLTGHTYLHRLRLNGKHCLEGETGGEQLERRGRGGSETDKSRHRLECQCAPATMEVLNGEKGLASKPQARRRALAWAELCLHRPHRLPASAPRRNIMLQIITNSKPLLQNSAKPQ